MLLSLLIAATTISLLDLLTNFITYAGPSVLFSIWVYWKNSNKESDKAAQEEIKKLKVEIANHGLLHQNSQLEREKWIDKYNTRFEALEVKVSQVDQVSNKLQQVETKLEVQNGIINNLNNTINRMECDIKEQNREILDLIKTIAKK